VSRASTCAAALHGKYRTAPSTGASSVGNTAPNVRLTNSTISRCERKFRVNCKERNLTLGKPRSRTSRNSPTSASRNW
jgi:hypothetical protein